MEKYAKLEKLGEGAHGVVTKARVRSRDEVRQARLDEARAAHAAIVEVEPTETTTTTTTTTSDDTAQPMAIGNTPKKRKHEGDDQAGAAAAATTTEVELKIDDDGDVELLEPIELPAPADTIVAIKKIRLRSAAEGLSLEAIREIKLLQELDHPNVLRLLDIFAHHANINLVLEYMTGDLEGLIRWRAREQKPLAPGDVKAYMHQVLEGMHHCHERFIMHRDMKPGNLLVGEKGEIKIADFGLAKIYGSPDRRMSPQACTIWYRAPELLFGAASYGAAADMWSIGCIFGELLWLKPMFAGPESELQQLQRIFALLGTPTAADWPHLSQLRHYIHFKPQAGYTVRELFGAISDDAAELLTGLLTLNPQKRMTAQEALNHRYFREQPRPTPIASLPKLPGKEKPQAAPAVDRGARASGRTLSFD